MNNYYETRIQHIRELMVKGEFLKAKRLLTEELSMPYIPHQFEAIFNSLNDEITREEKSDLKLGAMTETEIAEMLQSGDDAKVAVALSYLPKFNLHALKPELVELLAKWKAPKFRYQKAYLFELLIEQHVDVDVTFEDDLTLNAQLAESIFRYDSVVIAFETLNHIFFKQPAQLEVAKAQLNYYLLLTYPAVPTNGETLAMMLSTIVESYFGAATPLSNAEKAIAMLLANK